jgi:Hydantoinase/oxoprolinase
MGGTSTDVSRFAGTYDHVFESTTAGVTIQVSILPGSESNNPQCHLPFMITDQYYYFLPAVPTA